MSNCFARAAQRLDAEYVTITSPPRLPGRLSSPPFPSPPASPALSYYIKGQICRYDGGNSADDGDDSDDDEDDSPMKLTANSRCAARAPHARRTRQHQLARRGGSALRASAPLLPRFPCRAMTPWSPLLPAAAATAAARGLHAHLCRGRRPAATTAFARARAAKSSWPRRRAKKARRRSFRSGKRREEGRANARAAPPKRRRNSQAMGSQRTSAWRTRARTRWTRKSEG